MRTVKVAPGYMVVLEADPEQQGLKPLCNHSALKQIDVLEADPEQQGLKPDPILLACT